MEKIKKYVYFHRVRFITVVVIILLFITGIGCYFAGRNSEKRDIDIGRVQQTQRELNNVTKQLDEATRTNNAARDTAQRSEQLNESIRYSVDSSADAVAKSKAANARTSAGVSEAKQLVADAKRTATESEYIARDSQSIIERAERRTEEKTSAR